MSATPTLVRAAPGLRLAEAVRDLFGSTRPDSLTPTRIFLRGLGAIYLVAFLPWVTQILGLIGSAGVVPAAAFLDMVYEAEGLVGVLHFPSLAWIYAGDAFLQALPIAGTALAVLLLCGYANTLVLGALWGLYLSIMTISGDYGLFGWSVALLEVGFLALFLLPLRFSLRKAPLQAPPRLVVWAFWWMVFRLWFSMGVVKFYGGDRTWLELTFLTHFYPNQPAPAPAGWLLWQLPLWFHKASVIGVAVVELVVPFLIFWNGKARLAAALVFAGTSLFLFVAGHYAFFQLLALLLCVMLLDGARLRRFLPRLRRFLPRLRRFLPRLRRLHPRLRDRGPTTGLAGARSARLANGVAAMLMLLGGFYVVSLFLPDGRGLFNHLNYRVFDAAVQDRIAGVPLGGVALGVVQASARFYLVNPMGEFKRIPRARHEVIFEGSMDGETWHPYTFHNKPDDERDVPMWTAPFADLLGSQLYFEAQGIPLYLFDRRSAYDEDQPPRLLALANRFLAGTPAVVELLDEAPFDGQPPTFVRCSLYRFGFTDLGTLRREGAWWWRERQALLLTNYPEGGGAWHGPLLEPPLNGRVRPTVLRETSP